MTQLSPAELQTWLEWAGARLIAMPGGRIKPDELRCVWPAFSQEVYQVLEFRGRLSIRAAAPSSAEIPIMEQILLLPNVCGWQNTRRVLHARSLVHPLNGRHLYNWTRLAEKLETERRAVRRWFMRGLEEVVKKAEPEAVCRIAAFFADPSLPAPPIDKQR